MESVSWILSALGQVGYNYIEATLRLLSQSLLAEGSVLFVRGWCAIQVRRRGEGGERITVSLLAAPDEILSPDNFLLDVCRGSGCLRCPTISSVLSKAVN